MKSSHSWMQKPWVADERLLAGCWSSNIPCFQGEIICNICAIALSSDTLAQYPSYHLMHG